MISSEIAVNVHYRNCNYKVGRFAPLEQKRKVNFVLFVSSRLHHFRLQMTACMTHLRSIHLTFNNRMEVFVPTQWRVAVIMTL